MADVLDELKKWGSLKVGDPIPIPDPNNWGPPLTKILNDAAAEIEKLRSKTTWQELSRDTLSADLAILVSWKNGPVEYAEKDQLTKKWRSADVKVRDTLGNNSFYDPQPTHWIPFPDHPK